MDSPIEMPDPGRFVPRIGLGCMLLSVEGRPARSEAVRVLHRALELGVVLLDTADVYALDEADVGHNERLIAAVLSDIKGEARRPIVATKGGMIRRGTSWHANGRPDHLREACEYSLKNLGIECIDLYQLHTPDPAVPFSDSVGAICRLVEEGKVRTMGLSNVTPSQILEALEIGPVAAIQNGFGPWCIARYKPRVLDLCETMGLDFLAHSPFGGRDRAESFSRDSLRDAAIDGATPYETALAWMLRYSPSIVPIPGASRVATVESCLRAMTLDLDDDTVEQLTRVYLRTLVETSPARRVVGVLKSVAARLR